MNLDKLKESARKYEQSGQWRPAIDVYKKALREFEESGEGVLDPSPYNRIGDLEMRGGDSGAAVRAYEQASDLYTEQGFFNNAIALCSKILRADPGRTSTYLRLAQLNARKNFVSDAKRNLVEYLERMDALHHREEALKAVNSFAEQFVGNPDIGPMLVELLRATSRNEEAGEQFERLAVELESRGSAAGSQASRERIETLESDANGSAANPGAGLPSPYRPGAGGDGLVFLDLGASYDRPAEPTGPVDGLGLLNGGSVTSSATVVSLADLQADLHDNLEGVRTQIGRVIEADFALIGDVNSHLLRMQGKMLRPTLLFLVNRATGSLDDRVVRLAAVVELIHLATLVHDDSVDHSVLRRGMPTINALFSHQVSVIMGDYLYSRAVIELVNLADLKPLEVLSRVTNEMTIGEMRQLLAHDPLTFSEESYDLLIRAKTASLLSGACECGALRASQEVRAAMARFGNALGMAFQIVDDLLDFTEVETVTGKPTGHDLREHKVTLPLIHALPRLTGPQRSDVNALMAAPDPTAEQVAGVVEHVRNAGGLEYARGRAQRLAYEAAQELEWLAPGPDRELLRAAVTFVMERRN